MTPDNDNLEQIRIKSNTGRIVIDKTITDFGLKNNLFSSLDESANTSRYVIDKHGKIIERKKKGRMYSLGGNEPKRQSHLVRMKTVGTFDLCMEVTALACGFNQDILTIKEPPEAKDDSDNLIQESLEIEEEKSLQGGSTSISPKRQRNISSSDNSLTVDDSSVISNTKKKFRSLSSNSYLIKNDSGKFRSKSADLLDTNVEKYEGSFDELLTAASTSDIRKSNNNIYVRYNNDSEVSIKTSGDEFLKSYHSSSSHLPISARRRTFKKSKKIVRTDSEFFQEQLLQSTIEVSPVRRKLIMPASVENSDEEILRNSREDLSRNVSTDTVFSDMCEEEQQIDLEKLETEYKEHIKSNLQREYKSDGDALDEIGKERHCYASEWKNQSIDFEFLENDKVEELKAKPTVADSLKTQKKIRNDSETRTKSEGDKDTLYSKADSTETQSTEEENKIEADPQSETTNKVEKHQSLFEKRFGKLKKMNKLLKVKRFSTSALYDKRKASEPNVSKAKESQPPALTALSQVTDFASSKTSLASPKSLKGKRFHLKKRKFSFFGKSQSNNDLNINLKSLASKLSLLSKSNFDLSKNSSNLRLNAVGIYGKYGTSNEYRSDIINKQHGATSPLSEAFYNATGSYQLTPMELFEKFCSQDFTGLYKHESISEVDDDETPIEETGNTFKGAIKKSSSLRKATLLKQNSEPKFNIKNYPLDQYFSRNPQEVFEEEEIDGVENEEDDNYAFNLNTTINRRSSYGRQLEFDQNDQYFEDTDDQFYISENAEYANAGEDIEDIYVIPGKQRYDGSYLRNSQEILVIDETDEDLDSNDMLNESNDTDFIEETNSEEVEFIDNEKLLTHYDICPLDSEFPDIDFSDEGDSNLKSIITEYVKNACATAANQVIERSQSMDLLSNSSETLKTNSNSEYAFDTVKQINLDSCSTSKLSLSLNSDIFDDITLAAPVDNGAKTIKICEMDDFTLTPDGSMSENPENKIVVLAQVSEQEKIKNELQSQYTIIDCDELEHDGDVDDMQRFNDEKSSFAEALNKEFDKLFSRAINDSDTDITTTPSVATVLTAVKIPSRCSMEKLEALPFEFDQENVIGGVSEIKENPPIAIMSQSMTSTTLHQSISLKKEDFSQSKSKRSHSLGAINKRKSNKCTPL